MWRAIIKIHRAEKESLTTMEMKSIAVSSAHISCYSLPNCYVEIDNSEHGPSCVFWRICQHIEYKVLFNGLALFIL